MLTSLSCIKSVREVTFSSSRALYNRLHVDLLSINVTIWFNTRDALTLSNYQWMASLSYDCNTIKLSSACSLNSIRKWIQGETTCRSVGFQPLPFQTPLYNSQLLPCIAIVTPLSIINSFLVQKNSNNYFEIYMLSKIESSY